MNDIQLDSGTTLISFSTYPYGKAYEYIDEIEQSKKIFRDNRKKYFKIPNKSNEYDSYYNPLIYHAFGKYDLICVSLLDNFSESNKILHTIQDEKSKKGTPSKNVKASKGNIISGISLQLYKKNIKSKFENLLKQKDQDNIFPFLTITNLKLNNAFLLGNGYDFITSIITKIKENLSENVTNQDFEFILVNTFGSFELCLLLFTNNPSINTEIITRLRTLMVKDLNNYKNIIANSLIVSEEKSEAMNSHPIISSQTHFAVKLIKSSNENPNYDWAVKDFENFKTRMEWEIKPGHKNQVEEILKKEFDAEYDIENNTILGEKDYLFRFRKKDPGKENQLTQLKETLLNKETISITEFIELITLQDDLAEVLKTQNLSLNYAIFKLLHDDTTLTYHIRKIITRVYFEDNISVNSSDEIGLVNSIPCQKMALTISRINAIKKGLKVLKISKELKYRILKMYYNFNSVIKNQLVYHHFIDLYFFLKHVEKFISDKSLEINELYSNYKNLHPQSVHELEETFNGFLEIYKEAFSIRYVNNYLVDDASDFFLEYNSPIQQIISSFDNYFKSLYSIIEHEHRNKIITKVNQTETTANEFSVNFSLYNLYEPSMLFYEATKEIYSIRFKRKELENDLKKINKEYLNVCEKYFNENPNSNAKHLRKNIETFDCEYFLIDEFRFDSFFKKDFKFFMFYHLSFISQHPAQFDSSGNFNKEQFQKEFMRLLYLAVRFDKKSGSNENELFLKENCPYQNLKNLWGKKYSELAEFIHDFSEEFSPK